MAAEHNRIYTSNLTTTKQQQKMVSFKVELKRENEK